MIMKSFLLLTAFLSLAVASPVTNLIQTTPALGNCECEYPKCPLELVAECECKAAAALECYEKKTAEGLQCPYPMPTVCQNVRREDTATKFTPVPTLKAFPTAGKCSCKSPICPLGLIAECKCQNAATLECYESHLVEGLECPYPLLADCDLLRRVDITTKPTPTPSVQPPPMLAKCQCKPPVCPLELFAECRCKNAAAQACYKSKIGEGLLCPSPSLLPCGNPFPPNNPTSASGVSTRRTEPSPSIIPPII